MPDNLALGPDAEANHVLSLLRGASFDMALADHVVLSPGVEFYADPALQISGRVHAPEGRLLEIEAQMGGTGNWLGLNIRLGTPDLSQVNILGFVCRTAAPEMQMMRAALRSGVDGGFVDCFFDKHIMSTAEPTSHLDAVSISTRENIPDQAPWRELVLFLPTTAFSLSLHDLRLFAA